MNINRKTLFLSIILILGISSGLAQVPETTKVLLPLDEYLKKEDIKSYASKEYVLLRCSASFKFLAQLLASSGGEFQHLLDATTLMALSAIQARQISNRERQLNQSTDEIQSAMIGIVNSLTEKYTEEGNNNWLNTGSYFQDTYIQNDITYCQSIYNDIEAFMLNAE